MSDPIVNNGGHSGRGGRGGPGGGRGRRPKEVHRRTCHIVSLL